MTKAPRSGTSCPCQRQKSAASEPHVEDVQVRWEANLLLVSRPQSVESMKAKSLGLDQRIAAVPRDPPVLDVEPSTLESPRHADGRVDVTCHGVDDEGDSAHLRCVPVALRLIVSREARSRYSARQGRCMYEIYVASCSACARALEKQWRKCLARRKTRYIERDIDRRHDE